MAHKSPVNVRIFLWVNRDILSLNLSLTPKQTKEEWGIYYTFFVLPQKSLRKMKICNYLILHSPAGIHIVRKNMWTLQWFGRKDYKSLKKILTKVKPKKHHTVLNCKNVLWKKSWRIFLDKSNIWGQWSGSRSIQDSVIRMLVFSLLILSVWSST